jgi:sulfite reductase (ferredoxin)
VALDDGDFEEADEFSYRAMLSAARALVRNQYIDVTEDADEIVAEFKQRFFDTEIFFDTYARGKFGQYLLDRHAKQAESVDRDRAARLVEEAQLFIEATHACAGRLTAEEIGQA